jgi:hypothetical protein
VADLLPELQIVYQDLKYTVDVKDAKTKSTVKKDILKGLSGVVQPGRLTAVMGASGAGKVWAAPKKHAALFFTECRDTSKRPVRLRLLFSVVCIP